MASVAPEQHVMKVCPEEADLKPQPKVPGNGCPVRCCGAAPNQVKIEDIKKNGNKSAKWILKSDGRVIEYYVYGSGGWGGTYCLYSQLVAFSFSFC